MEGGHDECNVRAPSVCEDLYFIYTKIRDEDLVLQHHTLAESCISAHEKWEPTWGHQNCVDKIPSAPAPYRRHCASVTEHQCYYDNVCCFSAHQCVNNVARNPSDHQQMVITPHTHTYAHQMSCLQRSSSSRLCYVHGQQSTGWFRMS